MQILRTPDSRFESLPDFPFTPRYLTIPHPGLADGIRVHYLDEGPADAPPVLLMHGEPSWSYLYRHMIPVLVAAGHRVVVPDLVGFGRSDKPTEQSDYSYAAHVEWMRAALFDVLDLRRVTFFGQDWGGLVGLRVVALEPDRFDRLVVANTGLPTGNATPNEAFLKWREFSRTSPVFPIGMIVNGGTVRDLSPAEVAAYDAPFPDDTYTAGARIFPSLVPASPDDPAHDDQVRAWTVLGAFDRPVLCAFSDSDPVTKGGAKAFLNGVPGTAGQPHVTIEGGGHFLQEDRPAEVARVIAEFIALTPVRG